MKRAGGALIASVLTISGIGVYIANEARADTTTLDSGTTVTVVRTGDPYHYGRQFRIDVDGPVTLTVVRAQTISSSGGCHTTMKGTVGPHRSPVPTGAVCDGPGSVVGDTPVYNYYSCVNGVYTRDNLVVTADVGDGSPPVVVFDDTDAGPCPEVTTTTTEPPTTTVPPTTTTTVPGARHCLSYVSKPFRHCVRWSA